MAKRFLKDNWIRHALAHRYLIAKEDGTILRCRRASKTGELLSTEYDVVKYRVHPGTGRAYFNLTWMGITKSVLVNRVIAWAFHPNPKNLPQVNHIDGVKLNNHKDNLEWATSSENEKHAHRTGLKSGRGSQNSNAKLDATTVIEIRRAHAGDGDSINDLAKRFGVARSTIVNIVTGKTWLHV